MLTLKEALDALAEITANGKVYTSQQLMELVAQVSLDAASGYTQGSVTLLYSGEINGVKSDKFIAQMIKDGADIRVIDKTQVGQFLADPEFTKAWLKLTNGDTGLLYDATSGPWAKASSRFVAATSGAVRFLGPLANFERQFGQTELKAIINGSTGITSIEGFSLNELQAMSLDEAFSAIKVKSGWHAGLSGFKVNVVDGALQSVTLGDFLKPAILDSKTYILSNPDSIGRFVKFVGESLASSERSLLKGMASNVARKLGPLGALVSLGFAVSDAAEAAQKGDTAKAANIMEHWAIEMAGSELGSIVVGGAIVAIVAGAAALVGATISAPVMAALALGAAVIGGNYGSEAATEAWQGFRAGGGSDLDFQTKIKTPLTLSEFQISFGTSNSDQLNGTDKNDDVYGGAGTDRIQGQAGHDILRGDAGNDTLLGGQGNDSLKGGDGADSLNGGEGSDNLEGGDGFDTYAFEGTFGADVVNDHDGQGVIKVDNQALPSGTAKKVADNVYRDKATGWRFTKINAQPDGTAILLIQKEDGKNSITIQDWKNGLLGISLNETLEDTVPGISVYKGDQRPLIYGVDILDASKTPDTYAWEKVSWNTVDGTLNGGKAEADFSDVIKGSAGMDDIQGMGGNDALNGGAGNDKIDGGTGDDLIGGGTGSDTIKGGAGNDQIVSALALGVTQRVSPSDKWSPPEGKTVYMKGARWGVYKESEKLYVIDGSGDVPQDDKPDYIDGGAGNDRILASFGNDYVDGGDDDDVIKGLAGNDLLSGGAGTDTIMGDATAEEGYLETTLSILHGNDVLDGGKGDDILIGQGGKDELFGGEGKDSLWGDDSDDKSTAPTAHGHDYIEGGAGEDQITGGGKDDDLFGGADNDSLWGDDSSDRVAIQFHGNDYLDGEDGNDQLTGGGKNDELFGGKGDDSLFGDDTQDRVAASAHGKDYLDGEDGKDQLVGQGDDDELYGGTGDDLLFGDDDQNKVSVAVHGNDYLDGEDGNDQLVGGGKDDLLFGGADNDSLWGDSEQSKVAVSAHGKDYLDGEDGEDQLIGGGSDDQLFGGKDNDKLWGDDDQAEVDASAHGNDYLDGGDGDDQLVAGGKDDQLFGGKGNDKLWGDDDQAKVDVNAHGNDYLDGGDGDDQLIAGGKDDQLHGGDGNDKLWGDDVLSAVVAVAHGNDLLDGNDGNDSLWGGGGNDTLLGGAGDDLLSGEDQTSTAQAAQGSQLTGDDDLSGGQGIDTLLGGLGNDRLDGGSDTDTLMGGDGADTLDGGSGNDYLNGGAGADTYFFGRGSGKDTIVADMSEATIDTISLGGLVKNNISLVRSGNDLVLSINDVTDQLVVRDYFLKGLDAIQFANGSTLSAEDIEALILMPTVNADSLVGYDFADTINGGDGDDTLRGQGGHDRIKGDAGADSLDGGYGNDTLDGGTGNDMLDGGKGADVYLFDEASGQDTISNYDGEAIGTNADTILLGASITNTSVTIIRSGDDLLVGMRDSNDALRVKSYFYNDGASGYVVENLKFADGTVWDVAAVKAKALTGTSDNDSLYGYATADTINGGYGSDVVYGNAGNDLLEGGTGSDSLQGGSDNDMLKGGIGNDSLDGGDGADSLQGNEHNDRLNGGAGNDTLDGGAGNDNLSGGNGADMYLFGKNSGQDTISNEDADAVGTNADTILLGSGIATTGVTLTRRAEDLVITLNASDDSLKVLDYFSANGISNRVVENLKFADGNVWDVSMVKAKVLIATPGNDILQGYATADTLGSGDGSDAIYGYAGSDLLDGGSGTDGIFGGDGNDTLQGGIGNDSLYGGLDNDSLVGGGDTDWLQGDEGNDTLDGGTGNDTLYGGNGADVYMFGKGSGQDTIYNDDGDGVGINADTILLGLGIATTGVTLLHSDNDLVIGLNDSGDSLTIRNYFYNDGGSANVTENLRFADGTVWNVATVKTKVLAATGGKDTLHGYAMADTINGGDGGDVIYGYAGNDLLDGGTGGDSLQGGGDNDTLKGGTGNDSIDGGDGNDNLQGNEQDDSLFGGSGNDTLDGGAGNDYLYGGSGTNVYLFGKGSGRDWIPNYGEDAVGTNADSIVLGAGIATTDITLTREGQTLILSLNASSDSLRVENYFYADVASSGGVQSLKFADGNEWSHATVSAKALTPPAGIVINGTDDSEVLTGGRGDDTIYDKAGNDTLDGGAGTDTLYGGAGYDTFLFGRGSGTDFIYGDDYSYGAAGTFDVIQLGAGIRPSDVTLKRDYNDVVLSIIGATDILYLHNYFAVYLRANVKQIKFADNSVWDVNAIQAKVLEATNGNDRLYLPDTSETCLSLAGDDTVFAGAGNDTLDGGADEDLLEGEDGDDFIRGGTQADHIDGGLGNDHLQGQEGDDRLYGWYDNDTLDGGSGNDTLDGGWGNDTYLFGKGSGKDTIDASNREGSKLDVIQLGADVLVTDVELERDDKDLVLSIKGTADTLHVKSYFDNAANADHQGEQIKFADNTIWGVNSIKTKVLSPTGENDWLYGYATADAISALAGEDMVYAGAGNDTLDGGVGADLLYGEDDNDILRGGSQNDYLYGGNGQDTLQGQEGNDSLYGGEGNDTIDGGSGYDILDGGAGNDTYLFGRGSGQDTLNRYDETAGKLEVIQLGSGVLTSDVVLKRDNNDLVLTINDSIDTLRVYSYFYKDATGGRQIEQIKFADNTTWDINFVKTKVLVATGENDRRLGYATADAIFGLDGEDTVYAGAGKDTIDGGAGEDQLYGEGDDDILRGGTENDYLYGGDGNDLVNGEAGEDFLIGGIGNDAYFVDNLNDVVIENAGEGTDTISIISLAKYSLDTNIENGVIAASGYTGAALSGNLLDNVLTGYTFNDTLTGGEGNDTLIGNAGNDSLLGGAGNDSLAGGSGVNTLIGGQGDDSYKVGSANDVVSELADEGTDTVSVYAVNTYILGANLENLTLAASGGVITATGNALGNVVNGNELANTLSGLAGDDTLNGGTGADTLIGGTGDDWYIVNSIDDVIREYAGDSEGIADSIYSSISYSINQSSTLGIEELALTGTANINATGNTQNNSLRGNAGNNILDGGIGADTLSGGAGNDIYIVDSAADVVYEFTGAANGTADEVRSSATFSINQSLSQGVEYLTLTGTANINGNGNAASNVLTGNAGTNTLAGGGGNDTYRGGLGADVLSSTVATSNDTYIWGRGEGADTLTDAGGTDQLSILAGVTADQVWLRHVGNNLELSIIGTSDKFTINNWYTAVANQVESMKLSNGKTLTASRVENLVSAMAGFTPPSAGQTTLPANYQTSLNPAIAANWV